MRPWQGTRKIIATPVFTLFFHSLSLTTTTTTHSQASKQDSWCAITKNDPTDKKTKQSEANSEENGYGLEVHSCSALGRQGKRPRKHRGRVAPMHMKCVLAFLFPPHPWLSVLSSRGLNFLLVAHQFLVAPNEGNGPQNTHPENRHNSPGMFPTRNVCTRPSQVLTHTRTQD